MKHLDMNQKCKPLDRNTVFC